MKAIIFDWSGTLVNNVPQFYSVVKKIFETYKREIISLEEVRENFTLPYMKFYEKYIPEMSQETQNVIFKKEIQKQPLPKLYPGVLEILKEIKNKQYTIFVVSSNHKETILNEVKQLGAEEFIEKIFPDVYTKSPTLKMIISKYNLNMDQSFYVGDTSGDVEAGKESNLPTIGISWGYQSKNKLKLSNPDYLIDNILDIKKIIQL